MGSTVILALDSATEACSAALLVGGEVAERFEVLPRGHAARLLPMARELLDEAGLGPAQLTAVALCRGPGSFTGVRIAIGVAQGIAYAADLPLIPVSTLACLAQGVMRGGEGERVLAAIDARMGEVYWGAFEARDGVMEAVGPERVSPPAAVRAPAPGAGWTGAGSGWRAHGGALGQACGEAVTVVRAEALPRALDCLALAQRRLAAGATVGPLDLQPVYLRDRVTG